MNTGVFFDLDGTLVNGTAGLRFARFLINKKLLQINFDVLIPTLKAFYDFLTSDVEGYIQGFDTLWALSVKGVKQSKIQYAALKYAPIEFNNIRKNMLSELNNHRRRGHKLFLISASPNELVSALGKLLSFDYSIGTRLAVRNNVYTSKLRTPYLTGKDRLVVMRRIAKKFKVSLKDSYAYGNSINDLKVLMAVGHPVAVNPDAELLTFARKNGWTII
ncbi:Phosphoserine phosphatase [Candidatus Tiddalikarchaeum anstoanum]|nr:Phosphoserine phosphatase [Candidatus Tiddalikarchaeum anstoanum]